MTDSGRNPEQSARMKFLQAAEVAEEHIKAVEAERDRYRSALKKIAFHDDLEPVDASCNGDCEDSMKRVAREALGD